MRIPNCERAIAPIEKLQDYCLSEKHPEGRHKARVFKSALDLTSKDAEQLLLFLLETVCETKAIPANSDQYGQRYRIDLQMVNVNKQAMVRSVWIIRTHEDFPRLVSCYVLL